MHDDQLPVDVEVVGRLVAAQFPQWRNQPIRPVHSDATVNAIFRVGTEISARFPLRAADPDDVETALRAEAAAMAEFAACSPFATPQPVAVGRPGEGYPLPWSVQTWLPGVVATPTGVARSEAFADDLAALISAMRRVDTRGRRFARSGRGGELQHHDAWVATCLRQSAGLLDVDRLRWVWRRLRDLPRSGPDVMCHGDLTPPNLLVEGDRLVGVLDAGGFGPADPSLDLVSAWHLLERGPRERLRRALGSGDVEWGRGAAWAYEQAVGLVWYYRHTNPGMSTLGRTTLARILSDPDVVTS